MATITMNFWALAAFKHVTACVIVCALCSSTLQAAESALFTQPPHEVPEEKPPGDVFPAIDLSYAFHDDNDVNLHTWSARVGLGIVTDWPNSDSLAWVFPALRFLYEESDRGNITRRGYLASFEYHWQGYDFAGLDSDMAGMRARDRPAFPCERRMIIGLVGGVEAGIVQADNLFTPESESGFRIGVRGRFSALFAELSINLAIEDYDHHTLNEFGIYISPLFRTLMPFGPFIGYRCSSANGFHENAFVAGFEANF